MKNLLFWNIDQFVEILMLSILIRFYLVVSHSYLVNLRTAFSAYGSGQGKPVRRVNSLFTDV